MAAHVATRGTEGAAEARYKCGPLLLATQIRRSASRPGCLDVCEHLLAGLVQGEPVDHLGPERPRAHLTGHEVGGVEPEDGVRVREDLRRLAVEGVHQVRRVQPRVRGDPATHLRGYRLLIGPGIAGKERLERLDLGTIAERRHELATTEYRLVGRVDRRQVEGPNVAVLSDGDVCLLGRPLVLVLSL